MYIRPRIGIALLLITALVAAGLTAWLLPRSEPTPMRQTQATPTLPPVQAISSGSDAYRLAATDMATAPTPQQLTQYQVALTSIRMRCPALDLLAETTQTRQALHDQARRDVPALEVLQGVDEMLGANPDATTCSGVFARYLTSPSRLGSLMLKHQG